MTARHPDTPTAEQTEMTAKPSADTTGKSAAEMSKPAKPTQTAAFTAPNEPAQPSAKPPAEQVESTTEQTTEPPTKPSDWYADTLRAIVRRALDSDKPDIKGALAALAMLAEVAEPTAKQEYDVAHILRDARRRAIHGKQQTE